MNPERARLLRDRERGLHRPHPLAIQPGTRKHREIRFSKRRPRQAEEAYMKLVMLERLEVEPGIHPNSLSVWYEVTEYNMRELEAALTKLGFHLDNSLYCKLIRTYDERFPESVGGAIAGTVDILRRLHRAGYPLYGLSNWSSDFMVAHPT